MTTSPEDGPAPSRVGHGELRFTGTRTSRAWTLLAVGVLMVLLMLVFILQNGQKTRLNFLWLHGSPPVGASLLLAAVIGALIVVCLSAGRLLQLRLAARRHRLTSDADMGN